MTYWPGDRNAADMKEQPRLHKRANTVEFEWKLNKNVKRVESSHSFVQETSLCESNKGPVELSWVDIY